MEMYFVYMYGDVFCVYVWRCIYVYMYGDVFMCINIYRGQGH